MTSENVINFKIRVVKYANMHFKNIDAKRVLAIAKEYGINKLKEGVYEVRIKQMFKPERNVFVDLNHFVFVCDCESYRYYNESDYHIKIGNKRIYLCKHMLAALMLIAEHEKNAIARELVEILTARKVRSSARDNL